MVYTVTLNPALDYTLWADDLRLGEVNRCRRAEIYCGGKGVNVSLVLNELGVENRALGFIAGFTGEEFARTLERRGVNGDFIRLPSGLTRVNVKLKCGSETDINAAGPDIDAASAAKLIDKIDSLVREGDVLVLAGSVPASAGDDIYRRILQRVSHRGAITVVDTAGAPLRLALDCEPFLIKPNRAELEETLCGRLTDDADILSAARRLQALGARNVLVSLGAEGALLLDEAGKSLRMNAVPCEAVNTVGAGDSMVAGFIAGYLRGGDSEYALRLGVCAGGATASGEGLASAEEIERFLNL